MLSSAPAEIFAARRSLDALSEGDAGYDAAIVRLMEAEAACGEAFRSSSWSRTMVPNAQFAKRMLSQVNSANRSLVADEERRARPDAVGDGRGSMRARPLPEAAEEEDRKRRKREKKERKEKRHARDRDSRDRDRDRDRDRRRRDRRRSSSAERDGSGDAEAAAPAAAAAPSRAPARQMQPARWVRKGMRVRVTGVAVSRVAVVCAARDAEAIVLKPDGGGAAST
jgi:hypothetical protein